MKEFTLKSGAVLTVNVAPFQEAKNLFQSFLRSLNGVDVQTMEQFDFALTAAYFSSSEVERNTWECLKSCTYQSKTIPAPGIKVTPELFESEENRDDLVDVFIECGAENIKPFTKGLFAVLPRLSGMITNIPKSK